MKFIYFGDRHERPDIPENRTDDYRATGNAKNEEIKELARKHKVKALLQPGDFLHKPKLSLEFLGDLVKRWSTIDIYETMGELMTGNLSVDEVAERLKDWTPIVGAIGNHELYGESLKSYPKTSLAFLEKIGFMHFPTKDKPFIFTDENGLTVAITATSYDIGMDSDDRLDDYIIEEKAGDIHIHIVHGFLTNRDMGNMFPHTVLDKIAKQTKADLTISGHDHIGFPLTEVDGKYFINPGSPIRMKNDKKEMSRRPKVLLIEATKETGLSIKTIYLKSAPKGEDVLSREKVEERNARNAQMDEIKSIVNKAQVSGGTNITEIIRDIGINKKIDEEIRNEAIQVVSDKMNSVQKTTTASTSYTIEKMVLENFKSHVYSEFELSAGLNVFIGESGAGKSSIMSGFDWVFENSGRDPRRFIHHGKDYAKVSLYLSNGYIVSRFVERKKSGKNGYEIYNPMTAQVEEYNTKSLELVQELLGFTKLDIDAGKDVPLNFQRQGDGWFFIGSNFTSSMRARVIGSVYKTHFVDLVLKDLESETKKLNLLEKEKKKQLMDTNEKVESYNHIPEYKKTIQEIENKMAKIEELSKRKEILENKYSELCHIEKNIAIKEQEVAKMGYVEDAVQKMGVLMTLSAKRNALKEKVSRLEAMKQEAETVKNSLKKLENVDELRSKWDVMHSKISERNQKKESLKQYEMLNTEKSRIEIAIQKVELSLSNLTKTEEIEDKLKQLRLLVSDKTRLVEKVEEMNRIQIEGRKAAQSYKQSQERLTEIASEYQEALQEIGSCPVCHTTLNAERIEEILSVQLS